MACWIANTNELMQNFNLKLFNFYKIKKMFNFHHNFVD